MYPLIDAVLGNSGSQLISISKYFNRVQDSNNVNQPISQKLTQYKTQNKVF